MTFPQNNSDDLSVVFIAISIGLSLSFRFRLVSTSYTYIQLFCSYFRFGHLHKKRGKHHMFRQLNMLRMCIMRQGIATNCVLHARIQTSMLVKNVRMKISMHLRSIIIIERISLYFKWRYYWTAYDILHCI